MSAPDPARFIRCHLHYNPFRSSPSSTIALQFELYPGVRIIIAAKYHSSVPSWSTYTLLERRRRSRSKSCLHSASILIGFRLRLTWAGWAENSAKVGKEKVLLSGAAQLCSLCRMCECVCECLIRKKADSIASLRESFAIARANCMAGRPYHQRELRTHTLSNAFESIWISNRTP